MKFLTFGEIMLRLKAPGQECFFQSPMLEATFGGGEANVAVSLANYGEDAAFLTVLPDNAIADACKAELRRFDVDTKRIVTGEGRMGIYYLEGGANQRPSKVVYDRAWSAIALAKPGDIDWDKAFDGVEVLYFAVTGLSCHWLSTHWSNSFSTIFARSGEIIPPWGVPLVGYSIAPFSNRIGALRIRFSTNRRFLSLIPSDHICFISLLWSTLSKNPLTSNSTT